MFLIIAISTGLRFRFFFSFISISYFNRIRSLFVCYYISPIFLVSADFIEKNSTAGILEAYSALGERSEKKICFTVLFVLPQFRKKYKVEPRYFEHKLNELLLYHIYLIFNYIFLLF